MGLYGCQWELQYKSVKFRRFLCVAKAGSAHARQTPNHHAMDDWNRLRSNCDNNLFLLCSQSDGQINFCRFLDKRNTIAEQHSCNGVTCFDARRSVSRVLSLPEQRMAIHLGRPLPNASCDRPGRRHGNPPADRSPRAAPTWSCSRWGLPCRSCRRERGALLPHPFTLAGGPCGAPAVCSLWHFPWGRPRRALPGTVFPWSPDFPPRAALAHDEERPSDRLARILRDARRQQSQVHSRHSAPSRPWVSRSITPSIRDGRK